MPYKKFNRDQLKFRSLATRKNKVFAEKDFISPDQKPLHLSEVDLKKIKRTVEKIHGARQKKRSVMLTFGAHTIKNGMGPTLCALLEEGWITHLSTNGAGIIHDWEFAFQGKSSEDVRENVRQGRFGIWRETGFYINLAFIIGAYEGLGYGESIGKMISREGLQIPDPEKLYEEAASLFKNSHDRSAAAIDLAGAIKKFDLAPGFMSIPHPWKRFSVQCRAYENKIPFTGHPMIGHDIIYSHPMNHGAAIGRTAMIDFLTFANGVSNLEEGVYMSVGSAVMSPMLFEKSLSMTRNVNIRKNLQNDNQYIMVVDLADTEWDWAKSGEPPVDNPAYYQRYCKTFHRMGGEMHYLKADNRDFLLAIYQGLSEIN